MNQLAAEIADIAGLRTILWWC